MTVEAKSIPNTEKTHATYPDIAGKVALVTGSSHGIGFATAQALAINGAHVILNGRDEDRLNDAANKIRKITPHVETLQADFTDPQAILQARYGILLRHVRLDILVANVGGLGNPIPTVDLPEDKWRATVDANLTASFLVIQAFLPAMIEAGSGSIVTVASTAGRQPSQAAISYAAAKAGLVMLTRQLATEVGPKSIRVNCVAPGAVLTEGGGLANAPQQVRDQVAAMHPLRRYGHPEDIANAILFLASESASWITGITIDVCGGKVTS